jgi:hypothetical protein
MWHSTSYNVDKTSASGVAGATALRAPGDTSVSLFHCFNMVIHVVLHQVVIEFISRGNAHV